jgi:two-component system, NarL family, nitrate/nitrite response regulator NarL
MAFFIRRSPGRLILSEGRNRGKPRHGFGKAPVRIQTRRVGIQYGSAGSNSPSGRKAQQLPARPSGIRFASSSVSLRPAALSPMHVPSIRVVIADDHTLFREGVRRFLEVEGGISVVGEAADGTEALDLCRRLQPDVALLDVSMPRMTGIEVLHLLRPAAPSTAAVLLTATIARRELLEAVILGARGVVMKASESDRLICCIREVASGGYWLEHEAIGDLVESLRSRGGAATGAPRPIRPQRLTRREAQIAAAVGRGASNAEIASAEGLSAQTVKNHLTRIFDKLDVSTRLELALYAVSHRIGEEPSDDIPPSADSTARSAAARLRV